MNVGEYLFRRLKHAGVEHVFGIPGDFVLPHFRFAEEADVSLVVTTHEPGAGFAADAYARLRGLGVALTTFGAGGLNMINPIAQAYAERSPVLVVSGAPEIHGRQPDALFHHRVKGYESQLHAYREVTAVAVAPSDPLLAAEAIDLVLDVVLRTKRPGYLELPRDLVSAALPTISRTKSTGSTSDPAAVAEAMAEVDARLDQSRQPVIWAGLEIQRFGLRTDLIALVEKLGVPVVTSIEGKCVFPEHHPSFIGMYMGQTGSAVAREQAEGADCLLMLGSFLTDVSTGFYTAHIDPARVIAASADGLSIGYHRYPDVTLANLMSHLLASTTVKYWGMSPAMPPVATPFGGESKLRTADIIAELNEYLVAGKYVVVSDVGDCLYAAADLRTDLFLGPGYYSSMGFGVPAALAVPLACPERRAVVLVGDGGFQMTGLELATAARLGQNPIVILFNNGGYAMMQSIAGEKPYFNLPAWDYVALAGALGGRGIRVETRQELRTALQSAAQSPDFLLIDAVLESTDISPMWQRITDGVKARMARPRRT